MCDTGVTDILGSSPAMDRRFRFKLWRAHGVKFLWL